LQGILGCCSSVVSVRHIYACTFFIHVSRYNFRVCLKSTEHGEQGRPVDVLLCMPTRTMRTLLRSVMLPDTASRPSGLILAERTQLMWPCRLMSKRCSGIAHTWTSHATHAFVNWP
jgi:hypothetical protein